MRLILVSHSEVSNTDANLTELGRIQAQALADEIAALSSRTASVEAVYTSPSPAARETAELIATAVAAVPYRSHDAFVPDSEIAVVQERSWTAIDALREEHSPDALLVLVTHELPVRALVCSALSIPLTDMRRFRIDPASMTTLEFRSQPQRRTILAGLNETCHLEL